MPGLRFALRAFAPTASIVIVAAFVGPAALAEVKLPVPTVGQSAVASRGFFYVGGHYVGEPGKHIMQGQIFVEVLAPKVERRPYPLVLIHGAAQTATNWMGTPDGREGWAEFFVEQGYVVYMIDQPMRGRSAYHPADGPTRMFTAENEQFQFTAIESDGTWPGREKHTQWPGEDANKGKQGDPTFDAFYATQVVERRDPAAQPGRRRGAPRQDRAGDCFDPLAIGTVRMAHRRRAAEPGQRHRRDRTIWSAVRKHHHRHRQGTRLGTY